MDWFGVFPARSGARFLKGMAVAGALGLSAGTAGAAGMRFSTTPITAGCAADCPRVMVAEGQITSDTPQKFLQFAREQLARPGLYNVVMINSPGGSVEASIRFGLMLKTLGSAVVVGRPADAAGLPSDSRAGLRAVAGRCVSACVYTLMGARKRVVPAESTVGVHRMSAELNGFDLTRDRNEPVQRRIFAGDREVEWLRRYVAEVGGSQQLISIAETVPPDRLRILSPAEVRKFKLGSQKF